LTQTFRLLPLEVDVVLLALASELDSRYERIFAFLQNDVTRRRPTVDLALHLLCASVADRIVQRGRFAPDAPLLRHTLVELVADPQHVSPTLLAHYIKLDNQILRFLLGDDSLDARLVQCCERSMPARSVDELALDETLKHSLHHAGTEARKSTRQLQLYLHGTSAGDQRPIADALAAEAGAPLLFVDLARVSSADSEFERSLKVIFREAWFHGSVLCLDNFDVLQGQERARHRVALMRNLSEQPGITLLCGSQPWPPTLEVPVRVITLSLSAPAFAERRRAWQKSLAVEGAAIDERDVDALSNRFRLSTSQITQAAISAQQHAHWRRMGLAHPGPRTDLHPTVGELFAAARGQCGHELAGLTRKVEARYSWSDIVLPDDTVAQLRELCQRAVHRHRVMEDWGFDRKLSLGKGVSALFAGPSGTGKTMAAEIIANELGLDLYKIDLATVVSKYIGETEKNLDRIFAAAENANAILFFDEADALFGRRSEVKDSHDRYANLEISYLLQRMEQHEGLAILASNLRQHLDDAFVRRIAFTVHFSFPDEVHRRHIWKRIWPETLPLGSDVDFEVLARQFKLSGGNIKNIALGSAFLAAADGGVVTMGHLRHATQREYQKLGKVFGAADVGGGGNA
jgi:ATP-dependent 26S proteasome regulatory subunit